MTIKFIISAFVSIFILIGCMKPEIKSLHIDFIGIPETRIYINDDFICQLPAKEENTEFSKIKAGVISSENYIIVYQFKSGERLQFIISPNWLMAEDYFPVINDKRLGVNKNNLSIKEYVDYLLLGFEMGKPNAFDLSTRSVIYYDGNTKKEYAIKDNYSFFREEKGTGYRIFLNTRGLKDYMTTKKMKYPEDILCFRDQMLSGRYKLITKQINKEKYFIYYDTPINWPVIGLQIGKENGAYTINGIIGLWPRREIESIFR